MLRPENTSFRLKYS